MASPDRPASEAATAGSDNRGGRNLRALGRWRGLAWQEEPRPLQIPPWLNTTLLLLAAPVLAMLALFLLHALLDRFLRAEFAPVLKRLSCAGRLPLYLAAALLGFLAVLPEAGLRAVQEAPLTRAAQVGVAAVLGWALTAKLAALLDAYLDRLAAAGELDFNTRRRATQLAVLRRVVVGLGIAISLSFVLTAIPAVRTVGLSIFASAGVAGIVAGLAARPAVSNLIAGLQIAMTQPVRIGDAVVVEGVFGHVREISSTYVTIATWDQRSLILPLSYLLEKPVLNWTRDSAQLLDTVMLYLDYTVPVASLRQEVLRMLANAPQWDRRVAAVQVTDLRERTMEVRVLLSAADASRMFDLRCLVREQLVDWLAREHPEALPRVRFTENRPLPEDAAEARKRAA